MATPPRTTLLLIAGLVVGLVVGVVVGVVAARSTDTDGTRAPRTTTTPPPTGVTDDGTLARSVILVNGDGMGTAHREAARLAQHGVDGVLVMDSLPVAGLQSTSSADEQESVTDSAAAASAWATGRRTDNGAISVDVDGAALPVLGALAREAGRSTGLVTTAQVTDASPAAFFSNSADRQQQGDIARQYVEVSRPDVVLGGGADWWPDELVSAAVDTGYEHVTDGGSLAAAQGDRLLGLFADQEMFTAAPEGEGDAYDPAVPLADMTARALDVLSRDPDGFFLLVEEEAVDEMSHANNGAGMLQAMDALEDAVGVARAYVADHPDTLLIITGDHESGGLSVEDTGEDGEDQDGPFPVAGSDHGFVLDWTTTAHTGAPTPVTAEGPGSEQLTGFYPNTRLHEVMRETLTG
jgi:alkaline phosphatase